MNPFLWVTFVLTACVQLALLGFVARMPAPDLVIEIEAPPLKRAAAPGCNGVYPADNFKKFCNCFDI